LTPSSTSARRNGPANSTDALFDYLIGGGEQRLWNGETAILLKTLMQRFYDLFAKRILFVERHQHAGAADLLCLLRIRR
jgi:hypothetical protein